MGFVVEEESDATVSEEDEGPSFESNRAKCDSASSDDEETMPFGQIAKTYQRP